MKPPLVALSLGLVGVLGLGSSQQVEPPILSVSTDLVTLAVSVVDRDGAFVPGLRREQFTVYDNGVAQEIQFFTSEDLPATIGLVIDSSTSMRARRADVTVAGTAFAAMSHPLAEFFTVNFNERVWLGLPADLAFTDDPVLLREALAAAPAQGMTALYDGVCRALAHLERGNRDRQALIVVSDGGDNASGNTLGSVLDQARRAGTVIYAVAIVDPDDHDARPQVLQTLARETGGRVFQPKRPGEVAEAFAQIAGEIRGAYMLGFMPQEDAKEGFHTLRVAVGGDRLTARTRAGYYYNARPGRSD